MYTNTELSPHGEVVRALEESDGRLKVAKGRKDFRPEVADPCCIKFCCEYR